MFHHKRLILNDKTNFRKLQEQRLPPGAVLLEKTQ